MNRNQKRKNNKTKLKSENTVKKVKSKYVIEFQKYDSDRKKYRGYWEVYDTYLIEANMLIAYEKLLNIEEGNAKAFNNYNKVLYRIKDDGNN